MENDRFILKMRIEELEQRNVQKFSDTPTKTTQSLADRIRRAISWFKRAQLYDSDLPPRYVDLWISLNALYGLAIYKLSEEEQKNRSELRDFQQFLECLINTSEKKSKLNDLMNNQEVISISEELVKNKYLRKGFWRGLKTHVQNIKDDLKALKKAKVKKIQKNSSLWFSLVF